MITIIHAPNGRLVVWPKTPSGRPSRRYYFSNEIGGSGDGECQASGDKTVKVGDYVTGLDGPNYPMPAIRHSTMLINWRGKMQFIVVYPCQDQWFRGYAKMVADYKFEGE